MLEEISSTFVVNLRFAFQDNENMYMVIDLMTGGDLRFLIDQNGRYKLHLNLIVSLPESHVIFYIAELCISLSTLHIRGIIHRDVKPDVNTTLNPLECPPRRRRTCLSYRLQRVMPFHTFQIPISNLRNNVIYGP
jgi:serine/threonine protein kinase